MGPTWQSSILAHAVRAANRGHMMDRVRWDFAVLREDNTFCYVKKICLLLIFVKMVRL